MYSKVSHEILRIPSQGQTKRPENRAGELRRPDNRAGETKRLENRAGETRRGGRVQKDGACGLRGLYARVVGYK